MNIPLLNDIVIIFGLAIAVLWVCWRLKAPAVIGLLLTGVVAGPYGLGLVTAVHEVEVCAEIGVVLLLFTIGIEFSLSELLAIRKTVLLGGSLQVMLTFLAAAGAAGALGLEGNGRIFAGFTAALSSTAIVLKLLQEKAEVDSPHGRAVLGILIFQDIMVVPMLLLIPMLAGGAGASAGNWPWLLAKGAGIILLVVAAAKWVVPGLLLQVARTRNTELFLLVVVVLCFGVAWLTSLVQLSLALGAFLAGLIISESEYSHQALGNILPFKDVFTTFFFVSIGMMLDIRVFLSGPGTVLLMTLAVLTVKALLACRVALLLGYPLRTGVLTGLALCQIGEFSFILARTGLENGLLPGEMYQQWLAVIILSMALTPLLIAAGPRLAEVLLRLPWPARLVAGVIPAATGGRREWKDHLVIAGYGLNGRNLAGAARRAGIPYVIIEMNPDTVRRERGRGEPIFFGDATRPAILEQAGLAQARVAVVAINDPSATRRMIEVIRAVNPRVHLIVRTRYLQEMNPLAKLGADEVIPEEFETAMEIFTRVLTRYLIPRDEIERLVAEMRTNGYAMLRRPAPPAAGLADLRAELPGVEILPVRIGAGSFLEGKTLQELDLRKQFGATVAALRRGGEVVPNPSANRPLAAGDVLYLLGTPAELARIFELSRAASPPPSVD